MAFIEAFHGIRYNDKFKKEIDKIITLPYDKIDPIQKKVYMEKHPYNFVHLILNEHKKAKELLKEWLSKDILIRDTDPSLYFYVQEFAHPITGKILKRKGIISLVKLEDFGKNIFPHEKTLKKPKEDRLNLIRETQANLGQIFMLYKDEGDSIINYIEKNLSGSCVYNFSGEPGKSHKLWKISNLSLIDKIKEAFEAKRIFIADGHHRYEVSNIYRKEMKDRIKEFTYPENPEFVMATLVNVFQESITILPTHRKIKTEMKDIDLLKVWKNYFTIHQVNSREVLKKILLEKAKEHPIGVHIKDKYILLIPMMEKIKKFFDPKRSIKWNLLDVNILHRVIIDNMKILDLNFFREWDECKNSGYICFFLNPTNKFDVLDIAEKLEKMPQKSTDFYPKLPSGLIINKMRLKEEKP